MCLQVGRMGRRVCLSVVLVVLSAMMAGAAAKPDSDVLYQVSTIDSLMAGLYDGWTTIGELSKHGDFGLGTFDKLDGEMIVVDGIVYQIASDGSVHRPSAAVTTPFAAVTTFDKDITAAIPKEMDLPALKGYLDSMLPSKNVFYAIRIDGTFPEVRTRSVPRQSKPYQRLTSVVEHQPEFEFTNVKGTIVALRCPYYVKGVNVPGYHMHFITADRKRGGHILDCTVKAGVVTLDLTGELTLVLPRDKEFYHTDFESAGPDSVQKVEQGK
jgi:acetolactate decarboxylase